MSRAVTVGAAQMGPVQRDDSRADVVERMLALLHDAHGARCRARRLPRARADDVLPPLVLRGRGRDRLVVRDRDAVCRHASRCSTRRPASASGSASASRSRRPTGTATTRRSSSDRDGREIGRYRKVHLPGHDEHEPWRAVPAPREALLRGRARRLPGVARVRRRRRAWRSATTAVGPRPTACSGCRASSWC